MNPRDNFFSPPAAVMDAAPAAPQHAVPAQGGVGRRSTEDDASQDSISLIDLLVQVLETGASDLHITAGA
ncbi:MAG: hypothetical protein ABJA87_11670, partial [bacterium]